MTDDETVYFFGERFHPLLQRVALIGEGEVGAVVAAGARNAPGDRAVVGHAHDQPALATHQSRDFRHDPPVFAGGDRPFPMAQALWAIKQSTGSAICTVNSIRFWEYDWIGGVFVRTERYPTCVCGVADKRPFRPLARHATKVNGGPVCPLSGKTSKQRSPRSAAMHAR